MTVSGVELQELKLDGVGVRLILRGLLTMIRRVLTEMLARRGNLSNGMSRKRMSPETRRKYPTGYRTVAIDIRGHNQRRRQSPEHVARRVASMRRTWKRKRSKLSIVTERNPYSSARNPREYSRWYHEHHPGYFAGKTKEWIRRLPESRRSALFAERNQRMRTYVTAYSKLRRRLLGLARGPPSFTTREKVEIENSAYLSQLFRKVRAQYPR